MSEQRWQLPAAVTLSDELRGLGLPDPLLALLLRRGHHSKAAIETETLIWAKDLAGTGVTCNSLIPGGAVDTDFVSPAMRAATSGDGRGLLRADVMNAAVVWLASSLSDGVTGKRYVGKEWNAALPAHEAAAGALEPPVLRTPDRA